MNDESWIKNLATAKFKEGRWMPDNPDKVERQLQLRIHDCMNHLYLEARDICDTFNSHASSNLTLRLLPLENNIGGGLTGMVILLEKAQLKIIFQDGIIRTGLIVINEFKTSRKYSSAYIPTYDSLGSLYWKSDAGILMDLDLLIKTTFEVIVREVLSKQSNDSE